MNAATTNLAAHEVCGASLHRGERRRVVTTRGQMRRDVAASSLGLFDREQLMTKPNLFLFPAARVSSVRDAGAAREPGERGEE